MEVEGWYRLLLCDTVGQRGAARGYKVERVEGRQPELTFELRLLSKGSVTTQ